MKVVWKRPIILSDYAIRAFTEFEPDYDGKIVAELLTEGEEPALQKIGTFNYVNNNGQELASGSLDEWLMNNNTAPMYAQHNKSTLPGGRWTDFNLEGNNFYGRPRINPSTSLGKDIIAVIRSGDARGISWTVYPYKEEDITTRDRKADEPSFFLGSEDEVMVLKRGRLVEASIVYAPADRTAIFCSPKLGSNVQQQNPLELIINQAVAQRKFRYELVKDYLRRKK